MNAADKNNQPKVLILGIGNLLWADEGFGVRAIEALNEQFRFSENVQLMDGGTQGIYLIQHVQAADILVVFDAIDYGLKPGSMKLILDDDVPKFMGAKKMSLHQTGFQEVLATADLLDGSPDRLMLIGVQPVELEDYGGSLRPAVKAQIQPAITEALAFLEALGITAEMRDQAPQSAELLAATETNIDSYETQRPSPYTACRDGDDCIIFNNIYTFAPTNLNPEEEMMSVNVDNRKPL